MQIRSRFRSGGAIHCGLASGETGAVELLFAMSILVLALITTVALLALPQMQQKLAVQRHRRELIRGVATMIASTLADSMSCSLSLGTKGPEDQPVLDRGVVRIARVGRPPSQLNDADGSIGSFRIENSRLVHGVHLNGTAYLFDFEIEGRLADSQMHLTVPVYADFRSDVGIRNCFATIRLESGDTLEQSACKSIGTLELEKKFGTVGECETYLVRKILNQPKGPTENGHDEGVGIAAFRKRDSTSFAVQMGGDQ